MDNPVNFFHGHLNKRDYNVMSCNVMVSCTDKKRSFHLALEQRLERAINKKTEEYPKEKLHQAIMKQCGNNKAELNTSLPNAGC